MAAEIQPIKQPQTLAKRRFGFANKLLSRFSNQPQISDEDRERIYRRIHTGTSQLPTSYDSTIELPKAEDTIPYTPKTESHSLPSLDRFTRPLSNKITELKANLTNFSKDHILPTIKGSNRFYTGIALGGATSVFLAYLGSNGVNAEMVKPIIASGLSIAVNYGTQRFTPDNQAFRAFREVAAGYTLGITFATGVIGISELTATPMDLFNSHISQPSSMEMSPIPEITTTYESTMMPDSQLPSLVENTDINTINFTDTSTSGLQGQESNNFNEPNSYEEVIPQSDEVITLQKGSSLWKISEQLLERAGFEPSASQTQLVTNQFKNELGIHTEYAARHMPEGMEIKVTPKIEELIKSFSR